MTRKYKGPPTIVALQDVLRAGTYNPKISEVEFGNALMHWAQYKGWMVHKHEVMRRTSRGPVAQVWAKGYPDLTLLRDGKLVVAELKTDKGRPTPDQRRWLDELAMAGVAAYLWRPSDWRAIEYVLE